MAAGADQVRHKTLADAAVPVAADFNAIDLGVMHPGAQELDDRPQFLRAHIGDEDHPQHTTAQVPLVQGRIWYYRQECQIPKERAGGHGEGPGRGCGNTTAID